MKRLAFGLFGLFSLVLSGKGVAQLELPSISVYNYQAAARDPFISAQAQTTLLETGSPVRGIVSGDAVREYLATIVSAVQDYLYVGGVSVGERPENTEALINGVGFHPGDVIPLPLDPSQRSKLVELSRSYGLPLQLSSDGAISIVIGRISTSGVSLMLPGFQAALYELPLETDTRPDPIKLERRSKPQSKPH
jgi:hypothetical protein